MVGIALGAWIAYRRNLRAFGGLELDYGRMLR